MGGLGLSGSALTRWDTPVQRFMRTAATFRALRSIHLWMLRLTSAAVSARRGCDFIQCLDFVYGHIPDTFECSGRPLTPVAVLDAEFLACEYSFRMVRL